MLKDFEKSGKNRQSLFVNIEEALNAQVLVWRINFVEGGWCFFRCFLFFTTGVDVQAFFYVVLFFTTGVGMLHIESHQS